MNIFEWLNDADDDDLNDFFHTLYDLVDYNTYVNHIVSYFWNNDYRSFNIHDQDFVILKADCDYASGKYPDIVSYFILDTMDDAYISTLGNEINELIKDNDDGSDYYIVRPYNRKAEFHNVYKEYNIFEDVCLDYILEQVNSHNSDMLDLLFMNDTNIKRKVCEQLNIEC